MAGNVLDDPARLKAERAEADREYNEALTRLDHAIQQLPHDFPHPPPPPDEHQITPLNELWKLAAPPPQGLRRGFVAAIRRALAPIVDEQRAFNSAVVDHVNRTLTVDRETRQSIDSTLAVLRAHIEELARFQSLLVVLLQRITPYVDTRDRDVAGLLRGLSGAIDAVAVELMKRSDALLARDAAREQETSGLRTQIAALADRLAALEAAAGAAPADPRRDAS